LRSNAHHVDIVVEDDGCGFDIALTSSGKGLHSMEKRARGIGAALNVVSETTHTSHSSRGRGTRTHVIVHLDGPAAAQAQGG
jgi:nitrate/nitrite-specific signal transduction histidine kinase